MKPIQTIFTLLIISSILLGCAKQNQIQNNCSNYTLSEEFVITNSTNYPNHFNNIWHSPIDNSTLQEIVIIPESGFDFPSRTAYYSASANIYWILNLNGKGGGAFYGPFMGYPCIK